MSPTIHFASVRASQFLRRKNRLCVSALLIVGILLCSSFAVGARGPAEDSTAATKAHADKIRVTDFRNLPVAEAVVKLQLRPAAPLPELLQETTVTLTDSRGGFDPPKDAPRGSLLLVEKPGYGMIAYYADKLPPRIVLPPAAPLLGTLIDDRGVSIPNALIGPVEPPAKCEHGPQDAPHPTVCPLIFARTNERGAFSVANLPIHKYAFLVRAHDIQPTLITGRTGAPMQLMVYRGGTTITGVLIGTKDKLPQPGIYVEAVDAQTRLYDITDEQGQFAFPNLPSREWLFKPYIGRGTGQQSARALAVAGPGAPTSLTLLLNQGASIAGHAINEETSQPLGGIGVALAANSSRNSSVTDATGHFQFDDIDALEHYTLRFDTFRFVRVLPGGQMRDYYDVPPAGGEDRSDILLTLRKRALVQGRVVDSTGSPVADAQVELHSLDGPVLRTGKSGEEREQRAEFSTNSNGSGEFKLGVYPGGRYEAKATTPNGLAAEPQRVEAYTTTSAPNIELRLRSMVTLAGLVVDEKDVPVTGALVLAIQPGQKVSRSPSAYDLAKYPNARSDARGEFQIPKLANNQEVQLAASHQDFVGIASGTFKAGSAAASTTSSVRLKFSGSDFGISVVDAADAPIAEAEVVVHYMDGLNGRQVSRKTDIAGRVLMHAIPADKLERLIIRSGGFADYERPGPLALPQRDLVIRLKRKASVTVKLNGTPAAQPANLRPFTALLLGVLDGLIPVTQPPHAGAFSELHRAELAQDIAQFRDLSPGWYKAAISGGGAYIESQPVYLAGDSANIEITIEAPKQATLRGRVLDKSSQKGIPGAAISIHPSAQFNAIEGSEPRTVYSDAAGSFEIQNAPFGAVVFKVVAFGYPEHEETLQASSETAIQLLLSNAPGALAGTITLDRKPVQDALLFLASPGNSESPVASAVSDAAGHYTLQGFPAGKYALTIEAPAGTGEATTRRTIDVDITDIDTKKDIDLPALVRVTGTVRLGGKPPTHEDGSASTILFSPKSGGGEGRTVQLEASGSFNVEIEPGTYNVGLEDQPGQDVEIAPGTPRQINLSF
ncbi:MAG: MSCRAMM family protein [Candidatus Sumerlaeaceae bacterium]